MALANNEGKFSYRTKHIDNKYHYIRELVSRGVIELKYCPTESNLADLLTKPLGLEKLSKLRRLALLEDCRSRRSVEMMMRCASMRMCGHKVSKQTSCYRIPTNHEVCHVTQDE